MERAIESPLAEAFINAQMKSANPVLEHRTCALHAFDCEGMSCPILV